MVRKAVIRRIAEQDAETAQRLLNIDESLIGNVKSFFYLFYVSVFHYAEKININGTRKVGLGNNEIAEAKAIKQMLSEQMFLIASMNKDLPMMIEVCRSEAKSLKAESAELTHLLKSIGWKGTMGDLLQSQSPQFIFLYSSFNAFLKFVLKQQMQESLEKESNHAA
jgi:hypothetical protein